MGKIILDHCVEDELWAIWEYIAQDNPEAATRVVDAVYKTFRDLLVNPGLGRVRKFRNRELRGIRSWRVSQFENYLIFYRELSGDIHVMHVYHGSRDLEALFQS